MNNRQLQGTALGFALMAATSLAAQSGNGPSAPVRGTPGASAAAAPAVVPEPGYVIGPDDVLSIIFWREKDMSGDVVVRPDGRISLPLLNEVEASGLTPDQLREALTTAAERFMQDPTVAVVVKAINSRRVFITGQVVKPGQYPMMASTTVLQLITVAGGLLEYAKEDRIIVIRQENGRPTRYRFNYKDVIEGKNMRQNIDLKPGDTVIVP